CHGCQLSLSRVVLSGKERRATPRRRGCAPSHTGEGSHVSVLGESVCPYCGVGCRLRFEAAPGDGLRVRGVEGAAAHLGRIRAKGPLLGPTVATADRLTRPQLRLSRHDDFRPADWDTALGYVAECFTNILHAHGPDAVAFYGSGQLDTETAYLITKLFK